MYLTLIILPLLASIVSGLLGRVVGSRGAQIITSSFIFLTTVLAINIFLEVGFNNTAVTLELFRWIDSESLNVYWGFNFDALTVSMLIPVLIISTLVHIYSIGYMANDPHIQRFFSYLSLFTFMMVILVTANNLLLMFVGWEGVGVCSYLLVSFWYTRIAANQSSLAAFLTNRVGDCFLTIGMFIILWTMGNIDYATIFSLSPYINENIITIIGICLLIGAMAKSSQIGLHVWLPMAMEGPTPVSALIHAATMVTAGVYLLIRSSPLLEYSSTALLLCLWIGAITTVFSSLIGLFQQDIKKVIAYSTMSQLGMMVIAVGLSSYNLALFHLINHAFYKGLLFLAAGSVIHAVADNQDFRKYGGLKAFLPLTYSVMLIASLSLIAFPFMTGFYSKDFILESAFGQFYFSSYVVYYIASIGAIFTTLYSVKVLYLTFLTNPNGSLSDYRMAHEGDIFMSLPLIVLAVFSIFFGYITKDIFIGIATGFFIDNSIFIHPNHEILIETEFAVPVFYKLLPFFNTVLFTVLALISSEFYPSSLINFKFSRLGYNIFGFFNQRFLVEMFYNKYITNTILLLGGQTTKVLDKGSVEYLGPHGLAITLTNLSNFIKKLDSGIITNYALYILSGLVFYLFVQYSNIMENVLLMTLLYGLLLLIFISDYKFVNKYLSLVITQPLPNTNSITISKSQIFIWSNSSFSILCLKIKDLVEVSQIFYKQGVNNIASYSHSFSLYSLNTIKIIAVIIFIFCFWDFLRKIIPASLIKKFGRESIDERLLASKPICDKQSFIVRNRKYGEGLLLWLIFTLIINLASFSNPDMVMSLYIFEFKVVFFFLLIILHKYFLYHLYFTKLYFNIFRFIVCTFFLFMPVYIIILLNFFNLSYYCFLYSFNCLYIYGLEFYTNILPVLVPRLDFFIFESIVFLGNGETDIIYMSEVNKPNSSYTTDTNSLSPLHDFINSGGGPSRSGSGSSSETSSTYLDPNNLVDRIFPTESKAAVMELVHLQAKNIIADHPDVNYVTWEKVNMTIIEGYLSEYDNTLRYTDQNIDVTSDNSKSMLNLRYYTTKYLVSIEVGTTYDTIQVTDINSRSDVELKYKSKLHSDTTFFIHENNKNYENKVYTIERFADNITIRFLASQIFNDDLDYIKRTFYQDNDTVSIDTIRANSSISRILNPSEGAQSQTNRISNSPILQAVRELHNIQAEAGSSQQAAEANSSNINLKRKRNLDD